VSTSETGNDPVAKLNVRRATIEDIDSLANLFDGYRMFYGQSSDLNAAGCFLAERLAERDSVLFLAEDTARSAAGFTQLYPSFSSVSMARTFILNDLFVAPACRKRGVAKRLLDAAAAHAKDASAIRLSLSTALDNNAAQSLYVSQGWELGQNFHVFHKRL
jgi:ribosomal protein S18 acetylase RimI-like enzyme